MLRIAGLAAIVVLLLSTCALSGKAIGTIDDLHNRYEAAKMVELVPGVEVPVNIWTDDHVVSVEDLVGVGVAIDDAVSILASGDRSVVIPCTWSELKWCIANGIPLDECCGEDKNQG